MEILNQDAKRQNVIMSQNNLLQIDKSVLKQYNIRLTEYFFMMILMYYPNTRISIDLSNLLENGFIIENDVGYSLTDIGLDFIKEVETMSVAKNISNKDIELLAEQMRLLFPEGKKPGTTKYWRDNKTNVINKLKTFFKKCGEHDYNLILTATQKYVESYGENKQLMRVLPYFIMKDDSSDLLTYMENIDSIGNDLNDDSWTSQLT